MKLSFTGHKIPSFLHVGNVGQNCACLLRVMLQRSPIQVESTWQTELQQKFPKSKHNMQLRAAGDLALLSWHLIWYISPLFSPHIFSLHSWRFSLGGLRYLSSSTVIPQWLPSPNLSLPCTLLHLQSLVQHLASQHISNNKLVLSPQLDIKQLKGECYVHTFVSLTVPSTMQNTSRGSITFVNGWIKLFGVITPVYP